MSATIMAGKDNDRLKYIAESSIGELLDFVFFSFVACWRFVFFHNRQTLQNWYVALYLAWQGHSFSQRISVIIPAKANAQRHQV